MNEFLRKEYIEELFGTITIGEFNSIKEEIQKHLQNQQWLYNPKKFMKTYSYIHHKKTPTLKDTIVIELMDQIYFHLFISVKCSNIQST